MTKHIQIVRVKDGNNITIIVEKNYAIPVDTTIS